MRSSNGLEIPKKCMVPCMYIILQVCDIMNRLFDMDERDSENNVECFDIGDCVCMQILSVKGNVFENTVKLP